MVLSAGYAYRLRGAVVKKEFELGFGMLTGCNTIEGAGKDMERGGEKVQDTAKDVKQKM